MSPLVKPVSGIIWHYLRVLLKSPMKKIQWKGLSEKDFHLVLRQRKKMKKKAHYKNRLAHHEKEVFWLHEQNTQMDSTFAGH